MSQRGRIFIELALAMVLLSPVASAQKPPAPRPPPSGPPSTNPGQPTTAHWGIDDPAAVDGTPEDQRRAFTRAFRELDARIKLLTSLRLESLDAIALRKELDAIGSTGAGG